MFTQFERTAMRRGLLYNHFDYLLMFVGNDAYS